MSRQLGRPAHVQHIPPAEDQESHRERRNQRERAERDRAEGENSRELRGGGFVVLLTFAAIVPQIAG